MSKVKKLDPQGGEEKRAEEKPAEKKFLKPEQAWAIERHDLAKKLRKKDIDVMEATSAMLSSVIREAQVKLASIQKERAAVKSSLESMDRDYRAFVEALKKEHGIPEGEGFGFHPDTLEINPAG